MLPELTPTPNSTEAVPSTPHPESPVAAAATETLTTEPSTSSSPTSPTPGDAGGAENPPPTSSKRVQGPRHSPTKLLGRYALMRKRAEGYLMDGTVAADVRTGDAAETALQNASGPLSTLEDDIATEEKQAEADQSSLRTQLTAVRAVVRAQPGGKDLLRRTDNRDARVSAKQLLTQLTASSISVPQEMLTELQSRLDAANASADAVKTARSNYADGAQQYTAAWKAMKAATELLRVDIERARIAAGLTPVPRKKSAPGKAKAGKAKVAKVAKPSAAKVARTKAPRAKAGQKRAGNGKA
jgi:hypothetical protein